MLADELLRSLEERGEAALAPVFVVVGEEGFLVDEVVRRLQSATHVGGIAGFNDDRYIAGEANAHVDSVLAAARSVPMMAKRRFVLVRSIDRWEARSGDDGAPAAEAKKGKGESPLDRLASYAADPSPMCVLVLTASKLHAQRRLMTAAKKGGFLVSCDPVKRHQVGGWVAGRAKRLGNPIARDVADHVGDLIGTDLGALADAVERLSLYVGPGKEIGEDAVSEMIAPVRSAMMWDLTDAVCARDLPKALRTLAELELGRGAELPMLGAIGSSVRKLAKFAERVDAGESAEAAAAAAGMPPFKARDTMQIVKKLPRATLSRWLRLLAETDVNLKGGAKRTPRAVIETMIVSMCR